MPRLAAVPDRPLRALGIVRVSEEREGMIAPEIQWTAITDHCTRQGYQLVGRMEGLDESGSSKRSKWWARLDDAIAQVEAGDVDVIVGWKFSRTARNRLRWAIAVDKVESAGGRIESATEPLDVSTSAGRLARGMLAEFNAFEAERIGEVWKEVHARRTNAGRPANGKPRFGYTIVDRRHVPDPVTGPVLARLYRRYIAGESVYGLVASLNRDGYRTAAGYSKAGPGPWTQMTLRRCLDSGFGAGLIMVAGERRPGQHEPVVDRAEWETYLAARSARRTLRRSERSQYLLSGLMRCMHDVDGAPCGSSMGGGEFGSQRQPKFRCLAAAAERRHPGGYVTMHLAEEAVMDWLRGLAGRIDVAGGAAGGRTPARKRRRDVDVVARQVAELERQLATLTVQLVRGVIPEAAYITARDEIQAEQRALEERHARALLAVGEVDSGPLAASLLADWDALTVGERRAILRSLLARVEVSPGRPRATVRVVPAWLGENTP